MHAYGKDRRKNTGAVALGTEHPTMKALISGITTI